MRGAPEELLAIHNFRLVLVSICWWDLHPFGIAIFLAFALFLAILVFKILLGLLWLLLLLESLDFGFQCQDLLIFR